MKLTINKKIISIAFLALALFMLLAVSYAYFTARVEGNEEAKEIKVNAGIMSVKLSGPDEITAEHLIPGQSVSISFQVENTGTVTAIYNLDMIEVTNNFDPTSDLVYTITSTNNGGHVKDKEAPTKNETLIRNILIQPREENIQEYTLTLLFKETKTNQDTNQEKTFEGKVQINNLEDKTMATRIIRINKLQMEMPNFKIEYPTDYDSSLSGLYATLDDEGTTYYFRGDNGLLNNNVIFAGKNWKIIRVNGDGTIRIILVGTTETSSKFNNCIYSETEAQHNKVGFTFDNQKGKECTKAHPCEVEYNGSNFSNDKFGGINSTMKDYLEEWYKSNLYDYDDKIASGYFCNDTSYGSGTDDGSLSRVYYGAYERIDQKNAPILKCPDPNDSAGNPRTYGGIYKTKIGLITFDEMNMAGSKSPNPYGIVANYLHRNAYWWNLTPCWSDARAVFHVGYCGNANTSWGNYPSAVAPVINLKADVTFTGDGSESNPYTIS